MAALLGAASSRSAQRGSHSPHACLHPLCVPCGQSGPSDSKSGAGQGPLSGGPWGTTVARASVSRCLPPSVSVSAPLPGKGFQVCLPLGKQEHKGCALENSLCSHKSAALSRP